MTTFIRLNKFQADGEDSRAMIVSLSAISTIQKADDDGALIYLKGGGGCIECLENYDDVMETLSEVAHFVGEE